MQLLIPFSWVALIIIMLAIVYYARGHRAATCATIIRHLELIMRQNLPLPVALQLAAQTERGATRRALFRCGQLTQLGMPLSDALRRAYPKCPGTIMSVITVAERSGTLPAALQEWAPQLERTYTDREFGLTARFGYSFATWFTFLVLLSGVGYYVVPKFRTIAADFGAPLSAFSLDMLESPFTLEIPRTWGGWILRVTAFASCIAVVLVFFRWLWRSILKRKPERLSPWDRFSDWLAWTVSPFRFVTRAQAWSQVLPSIRLATVAGATLDDAVFQASQLDVNAQLRAQLMDWSALLKTGDSPIAAANAAQLPGMLTRWLAIGVRDGDFESALLFAERYYAALALRGGNLVLHILWPVVMFALACLTGLVLYSMLHVLKQMIDMCISYIE